MNRDMMKGLAVGVGMGLLAPMVFPILGRMLRPAVDAAVRAGILAYERGRENLAELGEYAEDMVAEARLRAMAGQGVPAESTAPAAGNGEARGG